MPVILRVLLLIFSGWCASAQLILNPGDVWTFSFTNLPYHGLVPGGTVGDYAFFGVHIVPGTLQSNAYFLCEAFEDAVTAQPGNYATISAEAPGQSYQGTSTQYMWRDLAGSVRLRMFRGACTIDSIVIASALGQRDYRTNFTPDPTPPRLTISPYTKALEVSWWTNGADGYVLESTNVLGAATWPTASEVPAASDRRKIVTINPGTQQYFRLRK